MKNWTWVLLAGGLVAAGYFLLKKYPRQGVRLPDVQRGDLLGIGTPEALFTVIRKMDSGDIGVSQDVLHGKWGYYPNYVWPNCVLLTADSLINDGYRVVAHLNLPDTEIC
jgi:hypothetical protein